MPHPLDNLQSHISTPLGNHLHANRHVVSPQQLAPCHHIMLGVDLSTPPQYPNRVSANGLPFDLVFQCLLVMITPSATGRGTLLRLALPFGITPTSMPTPPLLSRLLGLSDHLTHCLLCNRGPKLALNQLYWPTFSFFHLQLLSRTRTGVLLGQT
jgi:hypothetical protein